MSETRSDVFIGVPKEAIDTPALLVDLDVFEANIQKMSDFFKTVNADLRPHTKTHKTPIIRAQTDCSRGDRRHLCETRRGGSDGSRRYP